METWRVGGSCCFAPFSYVLPSFHLSIDCKCEHDVVWDIEGVRVGFGTHRPRNVLWIECCEFYIVSRYPTPRDRFIL